MAQHILAASTLPGTLRWWRATRHVREAQSALWDRIRRRNQDSAYGREHGFRERRSLADLARLPIMTGEDLMRRPPGDWTSRPVIRLVPTSGTTAGRREIPYTRDLVAQFQAGLDPWLHALYRRHPGVRRGRAYWQLSPVLATARGTAPHAPADDTEYLGRARAAITRRVLAVPPDVAAAASVDEFHQRTLLHLVRCRDLAFVSVWNPSFLTLLLDALPPRLARLSDALRRSGDATRARELEAVLGGWTGTPGARDGAGLTWPERLWPGWRVVSCWCEARAAIAAAELRERLPNVTLASKGLVATEGIVTFPWVRGEHALALTSHVFEFIAEDAADAHAVPAHLLPSGGRFRVLLTTGGGLYRYELGDLVEVTGRVRDCPVLRFVGRHDGVVDLVGEKLSPAQVLRAVSTSLTACASRARFWMVAPERRDGGRFGYTCFVQWAAPGAAPAGFAERIEDGLRANPHYAYARDLGQLAAVRLFEIHPGSEPASAHVLHAARDGRLGRIKPPVLERGLDWAGVFVPRDPERAAEPAARIPILPR